MSSKDVQSVVSTVMELNINQTIPLQYYRMQFNSYLEEVSSKLKKLFMSELKETVGFKLDQDGCVSQLVSEFMSTCGFYFPLNNDLVSYFWTLCHNRKEEGIYMVDFKGICGVK